MSFLTTLNKTIYTDKKGKDVKLWHLILSVVIIVAILANMETGGSSSLTKTAGPGEYKCGKCFTIKNKSDGCFTKFGGRCSYVSHTDKAYGGSYFYCSKSCCER